MFGLSGFSSKLGTLRRAGAIASSLALLATMAGSMPSQAQTTPSSDPMSVVQQFFDAFNRHDVTAVGDLVTDGIISVDAAGPCQISTPCIGKAVALRTVSGSADSAIQVNLVDTLQVAGNDVTVRTETRPVPPPLLAMGIQRLRGIEKLTVEDGKIAAVSSMFDLSDPQTQAFVRLLASTPAAAPPAASIPVANDGATLESQPTATRLAFISAYGAEADQRWVDEHNRALGPQPGP